LSLSRSQQQGGSISAGHNENGGLVEFPEAALVGASHSAAVRMQLQANPEAYIRWVLRQLDAATNRTAHNRLPQDFSRLHGKPACCS